MLTCTMDVEERSRWLIATPSATASAQPYVCTGVGDFYARKRFATARSDKNSFILFYTLGGTGVVGQGGREVVLARGQALPMDCRSPQSYGTAPGHSHRYHLWAHVDGGGVALAAAAVGYPQLVPLAVSLSHMQPHFEALFELLNTESLESQARQGLAVHGLMCELVVAAQNGATRSDDDPVARAPNATMPHAAHVRRIGSSGVIRRSLPPSMRDCRISSCTQHLERGAP